MTAQLNAVLEEATRLFWEPEECRRILSMEASEGVWPYNAAHAALKDLPLDDLLSLLNQAVKEGLPLPDYVDGTTSWQALLLDILHRSLGDRLDADPAISEECDNRELPHPSSDGLFNAGGAKRQSWLPPSRLPPKFPEAFRSTEFWRGSPAGDGLGVC